MNESHRDKIKTDTGHREKIFTGIGKILMGRKYSVCSVSI